MKWSEAFAAVVTMVLCTPMGWVGLFALAMLITALGAAVGSVACR